MIRWTTPLLWIWASPWTLLGLAVGLLGLATGGRVRRWQRVLEFYGGGVAWLFERILGDLSAMTLGHVILGRNGIALNMARSHEMVHVCQYERLGPLFVPAYLGCSAVLWLRGKDAYRDNPFEREAYRES